MVDAQQVGARVHAPIEYHAEPKQSLRESTPPRFLSARRATPDTRCFQPPHTCRCEHTSPEGAKRPTAVGEAL
ncbi:hypothetical protein DB30_03694 [Enhygromyxa salina]|uniref:Uncharacterized protein n=1 Tax=Enhygromyxa salina TaxID=215803 RepID=A0A0C2DBC6_9BACT|nr:hypothetical protein DB30_03694 [Enhygromyxa salina]